MKHKINFINFTFRKSKLKISEIMLLEIISFPQKNIFISYIESIEQIKLFIIIYQNLLHMNSRISVIEGHSRDPKTEQLYDALRKTFLADTTAKKSDLDSASKISHLSHIAKPHTYTENHQIGETTLIRDGVSLRPTYNYDLIPKNRVYNIVNVEQRVSAPISQQQFKKKVGTFVPKQQVIVYDYANFLAELPEVPDKKVVSDPFIPVVKRKNSGIKVTQNKYNLFSVIDQPLNNLILGKSCTCPANELIASQRSQVNWEDIKRHEDDD